ncbi:MAG: (Fe-S)-binding protein [Fimbriimonas sp.]|nr:(Fe-S)-binding protein [Fimbriimonas sp.]
MLTCLCDAFYGEVGIATVKVLEHAGCGVLFDQDQTCCGQPPFNSGDWSAARLAAGHTMRTLLSHPEPVVTPSASCAAMIRECYPILYTGMAHPKVYELSEFLVKQLNIATWSVTAKELPPKVRVAYHFSCHGRGIGLRNEQRQLIESLPWVDLVPFDNSDQCCGFGGAFSATHGSISAGIGMEKLRAIQDAGAEEIVGGDMGCLMQLSGLIKRNGISLKTRHFSQLLAEAIGE